MKTTTKLLALILALIMCISCFVACDDGEGETTTPAPVTTPAPETEAPHVHNFSAWDESKKPTCTEAGAEKRTCACGESETQDIPAKGHTEVTVNGKAATCTEAGLTEGKKCSVCGNVTVEQTEIAAKGHTEVTVSGKAATCTEKGLTDGKKCSVCGTVTINQTEIPMVDHTYTDKYDESCNVCGFIREAECAHASTTVIEGKDATCTEAGLTDGKKCAKCGEIITAQTAIPATGHTEVKVSGKTATCTEKGLTDGKKCSVCGTVTAKQTEIAAKGHTEVKISGKAATCTEKGLTDGKKCSVCGTVTVKQTEIAAKGHTEVKISGKAATCTEKGLTDGKKCSVCDKVIVAQQIIDTVEHSYQNGICSYCGHKLYSGTFETFYIPNVTKPLYSNKKAIALSTEDGAVMYDKSGKRISDYYDYIQCPSSDGYCVVKNTKEEYGDTYFCEDCEEEEKFYKTTHYTYVLNSAGKVVYSAVGTEEGSAHGEDIYYTGEIIKDCRDGRIITYTNNTYIWGYAYTTCTLHIYDLQGEKIGDIEDVISFGTYTNGKLIIYDESDSFKVYDKQLQIIAGEDYYYEYDMESYIPKIASGVSTSFFVDGYITVSTYYGWCNYLLSEDLKTIYVLDSSYVTGLNHGTLVFSKVIENDEISDGYYLIDVSKCKTDSYGVIIPTKAAAVCSTPFKSASMNNYFGTEGKYALVRTMDGKRGYLSLNDKTLKLYDRASAFINGVAAVMEGDEIYIINENLERVSNGITGYTSFTNLGDGIFFLEKDDGSYTFAIYNG